MIDIKKIRENHKELAKLLNTRNKDYTSIIDNIFLLDKKWRELKTKTQDLESQRNKSSKLIGQLLAKKDLQKADKIKQFVSNLNLEITKNNEQITKLADEINNELLNVPNIAHSSVPLGLTEDDNLEVKKWGEILKKENKPHWEIAKEFKLVDFSTATKLSGSRFVMYTNFGAKLIRALSTFMLEEHAKRGYVEILPPLIINNDILVGTGQLPKFKDDQFKIENQEQYLIPTAEVPLTNIYRDEIINKENMPIKMCAFSPCFRLEAGSAGKDTRGLIRLHQFNKVELVQIVSPEDSYKTLEQLTNDAQNILQLLKIPYRVVSLCTADLGFSAAKTYDIELWLPGQKKYREVSSCSNCEDFQSRRMNLRMITNENEPKIIPHTLNGSGLAIDRVFAAILENYYDEQKQQIIIPDVLQPYLNNIKVLELNSK